MAEIVEQVHGSGVLVKATGCRTESLGAGVVINGGIVTNAHVVAGSTEVLVFTADGEAVEASVVVVDPRRDLALLQTPTLTVPVLELGAPIAGTEVVVLSRGQDDVGDPTVEVLKTQVQRTINLSSPDIYGEGRYLRRALELFVDLGPGDSGSGIVDSSGEVVGLVLSISRRHPGLAYAISATEFPALVAESTGEPVDTGECRPR